MPMTAPQIIPPDTLGYDWTSEHDLHVLADHMRIERLALSPQRFGFFLPPDCAEIHLTSRTWSPCTADPDSADARVLGVCVIRLQVDGTDVNLTDNTQEQEWNEVELDGARPRRWTRGSVRLPGRSRIVIVDIVGEGRYLTVKPRPKLTAVT
jgi:hypothetical protein